MFSDELKLLRTNRGLSRQSLSEQLEIPKRTLQDWELGNRIPPAYVQKMLFIAIESMDIDDYKVCDMEELKKNGITREKN